MFSKLIFFYCRCAYAVRIFLRRENWSCIKIEKMLTKMAVESAIFREKVPHKFSETDPSNHIISRFYTLWATFLTTKPKNYLFHRIKDPFTVFQISPYSYELPLNVFSQVLL